MSRFVEVQEGYPIDILNHTYYLTQKGADALNEYHRWVHENDTLSIGEKHVFKYQELQKLGIAKRKQ